MHSLMVTCLVYWRNLVDFNGADVDCTGWGQYYFSSARSLVSFKFIWSAILILCRATNLDPFYGLLDLPLLVLEVAGM